MQNRRRLSHTITSPKMKEVNSPIPTEAMMPSPFQIAFPVSSSLLNRLLGTASPKKATTTKVITAKRSSAKSSPYARVVPSGVLPSGSSAGASLRRRHPQTKQASKHQENPSVSCQLPQKKTHVSGLETAIPVKSTSEVIRTKVLASQAVQDPKRQENLTVSHPSQKEKVNLLGLNNATKTQPSLHAAPSVVLSSLAPGALLNRQRIQARQEERELQETPDIIHKKQAINIYFKNWDIEYHRLVLGSKKMGKDYSNFTKALLNLRNKLEVDIEIQLLRGKAHKEISRSPAVQIVNKTAVMLKRVIDLSVANRADRQLQQRDALHVYQRDCTKKPLFKRFLQFIGKVCITGLCCFVATTVGMGIGALTGPQGLGMGAIAGMIVGSGLAYGLNRYVLFQPSEQTKRLNECIDEVKVKGSASLR